MLLIAGCGPEEPPASPDGPPPDVEAAVKNVCATCHRLPTPDLLPAARWPDTVARMFVLANQRLGPTYKRPIEGIEEAEIAEWFRARAPESLDAPPWSGAATPGLVAEGLRLPLRMPPPARIAGVRFVELVPGAARPEIVACDMSGPILWAAHGAERLTRLGSVQNPARAEPVDLDGDGLTDLVVADLGSPTPTDERRGAVVWLRQTAPGTFESRLLAAGLGRVADVQPGDFDRDGDPDLVVGVFGWYTSGEILYLENLGGFAEHPDRPASAGFRVHSLDPRSGAVRVPVLDLDGDGRLDFVAALAQEHETVVAFLNRGAPPFEQREIWTAPHPHWGTSGLTPADVDGDGDVDFVLSNGDTLDDQLKWKPWQGVHWLENRGGFPFEAHVVGVHYGAHASAVLDLDRDGDLDIVSAAFLPGVEEAERRRMGLPGLCWFERRDDGGFLPRLLRDGPGVHATLDLLLAGDGPPRLLTGALLALPPYPEDPPPAVEVLRLE